MSYEPEVVTDWLTHARALEAAGRVDEAERAIIENIDHIGALSSVAHMHAARMYRLAAEGDREGANAAYEAARSWMVRYAASATSGGEGMALSEERDAFLRQLGGPPFPSTGDHP